MSFIKEWYVNHLNNKVEHYWNIYHFNMNPNHTSYNNEGDAFKHCYFQAELTLILGRFIANLIGLKHEDKPDNPPKEKEMDLHNNTIGQQIGQEIKSSNLLWFLENWQDLIAQKIMRAMQDGLLITEIKSDDKTKGE